MRIRVGRRRRDEELHDLRRGCEAAVRTLTIPKPFDLRRFCAELGAARGRPIQLLPMVLGAQAPCGLWVSTATADYIAYEQDTSSLHQTHIVLHEIGHLLMGHGGDADSGWSVLLPNLGPAAIRGILGRTSYTNRQEREAELIASLVLQSVDGVVPAVDQPGLSDEDREVLRRLTETMSSVERS